MTDKDALKLEEMGYKPELNRGYSVLSILGVGFGLTNSWFGVSASLVTGISSGGPMMIIYGVVILATLALGVGGSLSELASAFPNSGGQYYWTTILAPKKKAGFLAYMCGALAWPGAVFTSASVTLSIATGVVGMWALNHPGFEPQPWQVFVAYELANIVTFVFNCHSKILPSMGNFALYTSLFSFLVITIVVLACARGNYQDAHFVFVEFTNNTGWSSGGIAFIVGMIGPAWGFSCLDCATHLAEEVHQPERMVPIAIFGTVGIGFATAFVYTIAMFFSVKDLDGVVNTVTGVPILELYYQAVGSRAGAICLELLIVLTAVGCVVACNTWQARLLWSFSRDRGMPGSRYWSKVDDKLGVPFNAHLMSCVWVGILGCLYLGSTTAFNSIITGCLIFQLLSYSIPVTCLLIYGRENITPGPFWLGKLGYLANAVCLGYALFALVFFSFPAVMPVEAGNMNYICVVLGIYVSYALIYWFARGKRTFRTVEDRQEEAVEILQSQDLKVVSESTDSKEKA